jgi:hypothetical protein
VHHENPREVTADEEGPVLIDLDAQDIPEYADHDQRSKQRVQQNPEKTEG